MWEREGKKENRCRKTLLGFPRNRWMEPILSFINFIVRHLLSICYFQAPCSIENAMMRKSWSLSLLNSESPDGHRRT